MDEALESAVGLGGGRRVHERYRAVAEGVVRTGVALDSPKAQPKRLELGQEFDVLARETLTHTLGAEQMHLGEGGEVELVRLQFQCPSGHGHAWTSEKAKTGKVLVEPVGTEVKAPAIAVQCEETQSAEEHGEAQYSFGVYIGDDRVHTLTGTPEELRKVSEDAAKLLYTGGSEVPTFPSETESGGAAASAEEQGKLMRDFIGDLLEDNDNEHDKAMPDVHKALAVPKPVSQRLIDAAAYHYGQAEAKKIAEQNAAAATTIQAAYRGRSLRQSLVETKEKTIQSVRKTVEPALLELGFSWDDALAVFSMLNSTRKLVSAFLPKSIGTLPIKIGVAIIMEGLRPELEPILLEHGIDWEQAVTMVVVLGTMPLGNVTGDKKGLEEIQALAQDPTQFAHGFLASTGAASKGFMPDKFQKQVDAYLVHADYQEMYKQGQPAESFEGKLWADEFTQTDTLVKSSKRPGRGEGLLDHVPALCLFKNIEPDDLRQGAIGNVWLVAAIAAIAEYPDRLRRLFKQKTLAPDGRYDIELFHPIDEEWVQVSVDDRLPVDLKGEVKFMNLTTEVELWPCILEKAVASLFGSYHALDQTDEDRGFPGLAHTVSPALALEVLTGATGDSLLQIICEEGQWNCYNGTMEPTAWPDDLSTGPRDTDRMIDLLELFDKQDCVMCADDHAKNGSYFDRAATNRSQGLPETFGFIQPNGLIDCHAYSLIGVQQDIEGLDECDLVRLRNCWANTEWKGKWSDTCKNWAAYPKVKERVGFHAGKDGDFWMGTDDFAKEFHAVTVCLSEKAQVALLEHQKQARTQAKLDGGGTGEAEEIGKGPALHVGKAPSLEHISDMPWILHYGQLAKKKKGATAETEKLADQEAEPESVVVGGDGVVAEDGVAVEEGVPPEGAQAEDTTESGWHDRFFCLEADFLKYYTREGHGGELKGIIALEASDVAQCCAAPDAAETELELVTTARTYRLKAKSCEARDVWLHQLGQAIVAVAATKLKGSLAVEEGGKKGGKFGRWKTYHFAIRPQDVNGKTVYRLVAFDNIENEKDKYFQAKVSGLHINFPKTKRARQPWAFRIDTAKTGRKLIIDPGTQEDRDAWITELKILGARAPDKSDDGSVYAIATPHEEHHDHHHE
eukprot:COSAG02_NODE_3009_length_7559_cov_14.154424_6_plen_1128_part_00